MTICWFDWRWLALNKYIDQVAERIVWPDRSGHKQVTNACKFFLYSPFFLLCQDSYFLRMVTMDLLIHLKTCICERPCHFANHISKLSSLYEASKQTSHNVFLLVWLLQQLLQAIFMFFADCRLCTVVCILHKAQIPWFCSIGKPGGLVTSRWSSLVHCG